VVGLLQSPAGIGLQSGFILIEINNEKGEYPVTCWYTDVLSFPHSPNETPNPTMPEISTHLGKGALETIRISPAIC
jgi:hypothetical protein